MDQVEQAAVVYQLHHLMRAADNHIAAWKDGTVTTREVADALTALADVEDNLLTS